MIARQYAKATRVDRQTFGQPVLRGKVRNHFAGHIRDRLRARIELLACQLILREIAGVGRGALQRCLWNAAQHHYRVITGVLPESRIQTAEQRADCRLPGPKNVVRELGHALESLRQDRPNDKLTYRIDFEWHA